MIRRAALPLLLAATAAAAACPAENSKPQPVPMVDTIPAAADIPYPGTMTLDIDATDTRRGIFTIARDDPGRQAGPMVLLFPKWLPGNHSPRSQIDKLVGLHHHAPAASRSPWTRDPVDVFAFHLDVPAGAKTLEMRLPIPLRDQGRPGPARDDAQHDAPGVDLDQSLPGGLFHAADPGQGDGEIPRRLDRRFGAAIAKVAGSTYTYETTNYEVLVDSPDRRRALLQEWRAQPAGQPQRLRRHPSRARRDARADRRAQAPGRPGGEDCSARSITTITNSCSRSPTSSAAIGLEHHRSSEDGVRMGYFTDWAMNVGARNLLPHEYTHSWDGKFRRGADLWTPDYRIRCATACCGSMKGRRNSGVMSSRRASGWSQAGHARPICRDRREPRQHAGRATGAR